MQGTLKDWFTPKKRKLEDEKTCEERKATTWTEETSSARPLKLQKPTSSTSTLSSSSTTSSSTELGASTILFSGLAGKRLSSPATAGEKLEAVGKDPVKIAIWNVNGLMARLQNNNKDIKAFLQKHSPDVLFLSEVKLRSSKRHTGAKQVAIDSRTSEEDQTLQRALRSGGCLEQFPFRAFSLSTKRYAGTAILAKHKPLRIWFQLPKVSDIADSTQEPNPKVHDPDGRVILTEWNSFFTLHTYSPNNGTSEDKFQRRRVWDKNLTKWLAAFRKASTGKGLVYCGDLNCAPQDLDLSHPEWFYQQHQASKGLDPNDGGQPGCTRNEQLRFQNMLEEGGLVDIFRLFQSRKSLQPPQSTTPDAPLYTWRGHPGKSNPFFGRFYGKGMRIDHFLVSNEMVCRVEDVTITGEGLGADHPSFLGSDHCPMLMTLATTSQHDSQEQK